MKPGFRFTNEGIECTIVLIHGTKRKNVALLIQENTVCPLITVRDLSELKNGNYDWAWGHYFKSFNQAFTDYNERQKDFRRTASDD